MFVVCRPLEENRLASNALVSLGSKQADMRFAGHYPLDAISSSIIALMALGSVVTSSIRSIVLLTVLSASAQIDFCRFCARNTTLFNTLAKKMLSCVDWM